MVTHQIGVARRAIRDATGASQTEIVYIEINTAGNIDIEQSICATRRSMSGIGDPGIQTAAEALKVTPYNSSYRVAPGVGDWGWAVSTGNSVCRVRRDWYERPRHQSPCVPVLASPIFRTEADAESSLEHKQATCHHIMQHLSHEEQECRRCGAVVFVPDVD